MTFSLGHQGPIQEVKEHIRNHHSHVEGTLEQRNEEAARHGAITEINAREAAGDTHVAANIYGHASAPHSSYTVEVTTLPAPPPPDQEDEEEAIA